MSEIKASEILLSLDNRIKNIEKQMKLQEFQLRMIIDNFNKFYKYNLEQAEKQKTAVENDPIVETKPVAVAAPVAVAVEPDKDYDFKSEVRDSNKKVGNKRVAVTQVIKLNNGQPLVGANVLIYGGDSNNLLKKVTTNTVGRWQAFLDPNTYLINVIGCTANSEDIEFKQSITVPESDTPVTLPSPKIK